MYIESIIVKPFLSGDGCTDFGSQDVYCMINQTFYDKGDLMYAFYPMSFGVIINLPKLTREQASATASCRRILTDGTESYCTLGEQCTKPTCMFQILNPTKAERIFIEAVSDNENCAPMNFTFYVKGKLLILVSGSRKTSSY